MRFTIFQDTDIGSRTINQDRMGYCFSSESLMMIVADGMGGHARGEIAAQTTLQVCAGLFQRMATPRLADPVAFLRDALLAAHRDLLRYQALHRLPEAPRTTVVAAVIQDEKVWWAHAGDSRFYWLRNGRTVVRTLDHSKVQTLVTLGLISPQEQDDHPERNKVLNCLGSPLPPDVESSGGVTLQSGDTLLLCSDGLWAGVPQTDLAQAFGQGPLAQVVPELVRRAVAHGGLIADNATAIALNWEGGGSPDELATLSPLELPGGAITTTIAFGRADEVAASASLSDEDIERQIAEIQQAIRRSHASSNGESS